MLKILIADDHPLVRSSLRDIVTFQFKDASVVEAADADRALDLIRTTQFNLAIVDVMMPGINVFSAIKTIRSFRPTMKILVFTAHTSYRVLEQALEAGAHGVIGKDTSVSDIGNLIQSALAGNIVRSESFKNSHSPAALGGLSPMMSNWDVLTRREKEVAKLSAWGLSVLQIARDCKISPATVTRHRHNILTKLGLQSTRQLIANFHSGITI